MADVQSMLSSVIGAGEIAAVPGARGIVKGD